MQKTIERARARRADALSRPDFALPDCGPTHRRLFVAQRMRKVRRSRGLSLAQAVKRIREYGDGGDEAFNMDCLDERLLDVIEDARSVAPAELIFAAAHVYGVEPAAFTDCMTCAQVSNYTRHAAVSA